MSALSSQHALLIAYKTESLVDRFILIFLRRDAVMDGAYQNDMSRFPLQVQVTSVAHEERKPIYLRTYVLPSPKDPYLRLIMVYRFPLALRYFIGMLVELLFKVILVYSLKIVPFLTLNIINVAVKPASKRAWCP